MSMTRRNSSGFSRVASTAVPRPALLTRMSTCPKAAIVASTSRRQSSGTETSVPTASAHLARGPRLGGRFGEHGAQPGGGSGDDGRAAIQPETIENRHERQYDVGQ